MLRGIRKYRAQTLRFLKQHWNAYMLENNMEYLLFRANLNYFLPAIADKSEKMYRNILLNRDLTDYEVGQVPLLKKVHYHGLDDTIFLYGPKLFCTYHFGAYSILHSFMGTHNLSYAVVLSEDYTKRCKNRYTQAHKEFKKKNKDFDYGFEVINAETPGAALRIMKLVKAGYHIVVYIDGNTGSGGPERQDDRLTGIDFLGKKVVVRNGIAFLSHRLHVPVVPVISHRENFSEAGIHLTFLPEIHPDPGTDREFYIRATTQRLYALLEKWVVQYPEQWEVWLSLGHFIDREELKKAKRPPPLTVSPEKLTFNVKRFDLAQYEGKYYLFDMMTYNSHPLATSGTVEVIKALKARKYPVSSIARETVAYLWGLGVLIPEKV